MDSFYENLVIEFEADLSKTFNHALEQLQGYVAGAWTEEQSSDRPYLAVATDGRRWEVFSPRLADPSGRIEAEQRPARAERVLVASSGRRGTSLRDFLNRLFFRKTLLSPTVSNFVSGDFGVTSPAFLGSKHELTRKLSELANDPELKVLLANNGGWRFRSRMAALRRTTSSLSNTRTSLCSRGSLVWAALHTETWKPPTSTMCSLAFTFEERMSRTPLRTTTSAGIAFRATLMPRGRGQLWHAICLGTTSPRSARRLLKPLYEQLVDPATRHELGEFYTPDWLATLMTERLLADWNWESGLPSLLDPTCGSGTFLRATIEHVREHSSASGRELLYGLLAGVVGIDVNPLAVIVARAATYLLAIQDLVPWAEHFLTLPVFLANSLNTPKLTTKASLWGDRTPLEVDEREYMVPVEFVHSPRGLRRSYRRCHQCCSSLWWRYGTSRGGARESQEQDWQRS